MHGGWDGGGGGGEERRTKESFCFLSLFHSFFLFSSSFVYCERKWNDVVRVQPWVRVGFVFVCVDPRSKKKKEKEKVNDGARGGFLQIARASVRHDCACPRSIVAISWRRETPLLLSFVLSMRLCFLSRFSPFPAHDALCCARPRRG